MVPPYWPAHNEVLRFRRSAAPGVPNLVMKKITTQILPWLITLVALYVAFRGVDWRALIDHLSGVDLGWVTLAFSLTVSSYLLRARRWQLLFIERTIDYRNAAKVLILGFFMNNVLPARTGELVRAHVGSRVTGLTRTLVLASIASERLADGLMISLLFLLFAFHLGDEHVSQNLLYVACFFAAAVAGVFLVLLLRRPLFGLAERLASRFPNRATRYALDRFQIFINGLAPLCTPARVPAIFLWSVVVWLIELGVFVAVTHAFGANLGLAECVLFLVTVNFSSLIPAAPGGIGVIEAIASAVLVSIGVQKELALTMVIAQHVIQYLVVGIPGAIILATSRGRFGQIKELRDERELTASAEG